MPPRRNNDSRRRAAVMNIFRPVVDFPIRVAIPYRTPASGRATVRVCFGESPIVLRVRKGMKRRVGTASIALMEKTRFGGLSHPAPSSFRPSPRGNDPPPLGRPRPGNRNLFPAPSFSRYGRADHPVRPGSASPADAVYPPAARPRSRAGAKSTPAVPVRQSVKRVVTPVQENRRRHSTIQSISPSRRDMGFIKTPGSSSL